MGNLLIILIGISGITLWLTIIFIYTPACFNLKKMIRSIDENNGVLTDVSAPINWYITNFHTLSSWTIKIPSEEKYLKYKLIKSKIKTVSNCRNFMIYNTLIFIVSIIILINFV